MYPIIRGFKIKFNADGNIDTIIVPFAGMEAEEQAIIEGLVAARHGYPMGPIDLVSVQSGTWCPTGIWANPEHTAIYAAY